MITLDVPPKLILPDHYQANRPAIIRPVGDLANFFPVEIDRKTRRAIVSKLAKLGLIDDRAEAVKLVDAAIPFGMFGKSAKPITVAYLANPFTNSVQSTYTYTSQPLGDAVNRWIVIAYNTEAGGVYSSGSVGGVSTSMFYDAPASTVSVKWLKAQLTSAVGTTGTITVTVTGGSGHAVFGVWVVYGPWNGVATATAENSGGAVTNPSVTATVPDQGYMLAAGRNTSGTNFGTLTNATERFDQSTGGGQMVLNGGDYQNTTGSSLSRTITFSSSSARASAVVIS